MSDIYCAMPGRSPSSYPLCPDPYQNPCPCLKFAKHVQGSLTTNIYHTMFFFLYTPVGFSKKKKKVPDFPNLDIDSTYLLEPMKQVEHLF